MYLPGRARHGDLRADRVRPTIVDSATTIRLAASRTHNMPITGSATVVERVGTQSPRRQPDRRLLLCLDRHVENLRPFLLRPVGRLDRGPARPRFRRRKSASRRCIAWWTPGHRSPQQFPPHQHQPRGSASTASSSTNNLSRISQNLRLTRERFRYPRSLARRVVSGRLDNLTCISSSFQVRQHGA